MPPHKAWTFERGGRPQLNHPIYPIYQIYTSSAGRHVNYAECIEGVEFPAY